MSTAPSITDPLLVKRFRWQRLNQRILGLQWGRDISQIHWHPKGGHYDVHYFCVGLIWRAAYVFWLKKRETL